MVEVEGSVSIKADLSVKEAIESLYNECIAKGKNESDESDERSEGIFKSIDCLRKYFEAITNPTNGKNLSTIKVDAVLHTGTNLNSYSTTISVDGVKSLYALIVRFNGVNIDDTLISLEVMVALKYLEENYFYYINGINQELQAEEISSNDLLGAYVFPNYWEFLEIPFNSPAITIKEAYIMKYNKIEESLIGGKNEYTTASLIDVNKALYVLTNPRLRYTYNCIIEGKNPIEREYYDAIAESRTELDYDLALNQRLLGQMYNRLEEYRNTMKTIYGNVKINHRTREELIKWLRDNYSVLNKKIDEQKAINKRLGIR